MDVPSNSPARGFRVRLTVEREHARRTALAQYHHQIAAIGELGRATDCLPVYADWTAFLAVGSEGECVWVDYETHPGEIEPVTDMLPLHILVRHLAFIPGLEELVPLRPPGRADCEMCLGKGEVHIGAVKVGCACGGLGWRAERPAELGLEAW